MALRLIARLSKSGVRPMRLRAAMQRMREFHPQITLTSLPARFIVTDGVDLYFRDDSETELVERLRDGQLAFAFVVELGLLQTEVANALLRTA